MSVNKRFHKTAKTSKANTIGLSSQFNLQPPPTATASRLRRPSVAQDLHKLALGGFSLGDQRSFGAPTDSGTAKAANSTGGDWNRLIQKTITNGSSQILGGGLLGSGLSSLFSAVFHLFRGGSQNHAPVLQRFSLPQAEQRTIDTAQNSVPRERASSSNYTLTNLPPAEAGPASAINGQAAVVRAVRNALLTSSSLNDIVGEL